MFYSVAYNETFISTHLALPPISTVLPGGQQIKILLSSKIILAIKCHQNTK